MTPEEVGTTTHRTAITKIVKSQRAWQNKAERTLPPNLSLNLGPYDRVRKLFSLTILRVVLQSSVVALAALTAFYNPVRSKFFITATRALRVLSFIFVSSGTLLLSSGLFYIASVLDASEQVTIWKPTSRDTLVIWKQDADPELGTESWIIAKNIHGELLSAHRPIGLKPSSTISLPVALAIIVGFLIQSVGISLMHWPVQTLQLASIIIMFLGRCYVRKMDPPDFRVKLDHVVDDNELMEIAQKWRKQIRKARTK